MGDIMGYKIVVKPTAHNKALFRNRGLFHSDSDIVKDLAKELAKTKTFTVYLYEESEYTYIKQVLERLGLKLYNK